MKQLVKRIDFALCKWQWRIMLIKPVPVYENVMLWLSGLSLASIFAMPW